MSLLSKGIHFFKNITLTPNVWMQWLLSVPPVHMTAANTQHCPYFTGLNCVSAHILRISALPDHFEGLTPSLKSSDQFPVNTPLSSLEFTCLERQRDYINTWREREQRGDNVSGSSPSLRSHGRCKPDCCSSADLHPYPLDVEDSAAAISYRCPVCLFHTENTLMHDMS